MTDPDPYDAAPEMCNEKIPSISIHMSFNAHS